MSKKIELTKELLSKLLTSEKGADVLDGLGDIMDEIFQKALEQAHIIDWHDENIYQNLKFEALIRPEELFARILKKQDESTPVMESDQRTALKNDIKNAEEKARSLREEYLGGLHYELTTLQGDLFREFFKITNPFTYAPITLNNIDAQAAQFIKILNNDFPEFLKTVYKGKPEREQAYLLKESLAVFSYLLDEFVQELRKGEGETTSLSEATILDFPRKKL